MLNMYSAEFSLIVILYCYVFASVFLLVVLLVVVLVRAGRADAGGSLDRGLNAKSMYKSESATFELAI